tara:strand:- start:24 stop:206 length:183 start_codon:yes stop_codon:yes gene_type:complete
MHPLLQIAGIHWVGAGGEEVVHIELVPRIFAISTTHSTLSLVLKQQKEVELSWGFVEYNC